MTKKLMLGIFLASLFLMANLGVAAERPSPTPVIAKIGAVPSDCGCLKKDKVPTPLGLRPDVLANKPDLMPVYLDCHWVCGWFRCGWGWCYDCVRMCFDENGNML
jgi:hypothetical protein